MSQRPADCRSRASHRPSYAIGVEVRPGELRPQPLLGILAPDVLVPLHRLGHSLPHVGAGAVRGVPLGLTAGARNQLLAPVRRVDAGHFPVGPEELEHVLNVAERPAAQAAAQGQYAGPGDHLALLPGRLRELERQVTVDTVVPHYRHRCAIDLGGESCLRLGHLLPQLVVRIDLAHPKPSHCPAPHRSVGVVEYNDRPPDRVPGQLRSAVDFGPQLGGEGAGLFRLDGLSRVRTDRTCGGRSRGRGSARCRHRRPSGDGRGGALRASGRGHEELGAVGPQFTDRPAAPPQQVGVGGHEDVSFPAAASAKERPVSTPGNRVRWPTRALMKIAAVQVKGDEWIILGSVRGLSENACCTRAAQNRAELELSDSTVAARHASDVRVQRIRL